jgi:hypothetical protein
MWHVGRTTELQLCIAHYSKLAPLGTTEMLDPYTSQAFILPSSRGSMSLYPTAYLVNGSCHGVGRDINVQCVLIKEMIIIVDHYTLAVRNRR